MVTTIAIDEADDWGTWEWSGDPNDKLPPCVKFSMKSPVEVGQTELVCNECDVARCLGEVNENDVECRPFSGVLCASCRNPIPVDYAVNVGKNRLLAEGRCHYGRNIQLELYVCDACCDYIEATTMGFWRPFGNANQCL